MKTERNIFIAFILNLGFSVFEFIGGIFTGSVAIVSDSIHDFGDALSIGLSYFLERKSKKQPDDVYTYGYARYSILGSLITSLILLFGSIFVVFNAIHHIISPSPINYDNMIVFTIIGVSVNLIAALVTRGGDSLNQKAVNLHMLEDVLGWIVVLIGAIIMKFTNFTIIDAIMSIGIAIFIGINAFKNLSEIMNLFLEKIPHGINIENVRNSIRSIKGVADTHHIHIWSIDGILNCATLHVTVNDINSFAELKQDIRGKLLEYGIVHVTIEIEQVEENCENRHCYIHNLHSHCGHHRHHH